MTSRTMIAGCVLLASLALSGPVAAQPAGPPEGTPGGPPEGAPGGLPGGAPMGESVALEVSSTPRIAPPDTTAIAIVNAAKDFLQTLTRDQRDAVLYEFDDNEQRALWSNLPAGLVERGGLAREDMSDTQLAAFDDLLAHVLSADGVRNAQLQRFADGQLTNGGQIGNGNALEFGEDLYFVSFLGEPSVEAPWMLQYGGHHLAINATFAGGQASFSPMLTGGQPLTVEYEGKSVYITAREVNAARSFMDMLDPEQRQKAIVSDRAIQLLLGPGGHGATIAPEGIAGNELSYSQKEALIRVIHARISQLNPRDAQAVMYRVYAGLDQTTFGWWGPREPYGAAYFRIAGPEIVLEYSPQGQGPGGEATEHTHNMYRDPTNDYGSAWIGTEQ